MRLAGNILVLVAALLNNAAAIQTSTTVTTISSCLPRMTCGQTSIPAAPITSTRTISVTSCGPEIRCGMTKTASMLLTTASSVFVTGSQEESWAEWAKLSTHTDSFQKTTSTLSSSEVWSSWTDTLARETSTASLYSWASISDPHDAKFTRQSQYQASSQAVTTHRAGMMGNPATGSWSDWTVVNSGTFMSSNIALSTADRSRSTFVSNTLTKMPSQMTSDATSGLNWSSSATDATAVATYTGTASHVNISVLALMVPLLILVSVLNL